MDRRPNSSPPSQDGPRQLIQEDLWTDHRAAPSVATYIRRREENNTPDLFCLWASSRAALPRLEIIHHGPREEHSTIRYSLNYFVI